MLGVAGSGLKLAGGQGSVTDECSTFSRRSKPLKARSERCASEVHEVNLVELLLATDHTARLARSWLAEALVTR